MDEKILKILRTHAQEFISGEELGRRTSLGKATLARYIHKLRDEGYDIQTQPHWGYKLVALPDKLLAEELLWKLNTKVIGRKIISYDVVDSTNTVAFCLAEQGQPQGTAIFAEAQSKGRGRLGRRWNSPKSQGVYFSLILCPNIKANGASIITLLAAVSCAEAIRKICGLNAQIRWPNDILINQKKVCGVLTEMSLENHTLKFIIVGIGINVNTPAVKLPEEASSLKEELGRKVCRLDLARQLLRQLDQEYLYFENKGSKQIITKWQNLSALSGKRVKVFFAQRFIEGLAQDIDEHGALIVRLDNGFRQHVVAGDVVKVR